ncbi:MAG: hypothetical protein RLZZ210_1745 [Pseudomonadota bacterium]|jgi:hypothetical protein
MCLSEIMSFLNNIWGEMPKLTPIMQLIATAYIGYQQWQTNKKKNEIDLYEKKWRIYEKTHEMLAIFIDGNQKNHTTRQIRTTLCYSEWIFQKDIINYINDILSKGDEYINLMTTRAIKDKNLERQPENHAYITDNVKLEREEELRCWLIQQSDKGCNEKFKKYLSMDIIK